MKNLTTKILWVAGLLMLLAQPLLGPTIYAGEVIDHLPEVQLARSITQYLAVQSLLDNGFEGICANAPGIEDVPDHLWLDELGNIRSTEAVQDVLLSTLCAFEGIEPSAEVFDVYDNEFEFFIDILSGKDVEVANGVFVFGSKQPVRAALTFPFAISLFFELFLGDLSNEPSPVLGENPCQTLRTFASEGPSLEIRWSAFLTLAVDLSLDAEDPSEATCTTLNDQEPDVLLQQAQRGDLNAALQLAYNWDNEISSVVDADEVDPSLVDAQIERFQLIALNHFGEGFVGLAVTIPLISLMEGNAALAS